MLKKPNLWLLAPVAAAVLGLGSMAEAAGGKGREKDESREIEMRQRWFAETRGLTENPDAHTLRASAVDATESDELSMKAFRFAVGETWQEMGPSSQNMNGWRMGKVAGRANVVLPDPRNDDVVYFGAAAGGLWKSADAGQSWTPLFDNVGTLPIGALAFSPSNADHLWVGTGDKNGGGCAGYFGMGVFLSEDGGQTWQARNGSGASALPLSIVNAVAVHPQNENLILAGGAGMCGSNGALTGPGIFRSEDRGQTWTKVIAANTEDIHFVPGTDTVYAGVYGNGVQRSDDGGKTWRPVNNGFAFVSGRIRLGLSASDPNVLYTLQGGTVHRTRDGGASWTKLATNACDGQCTYNLTLDVHPSDPNTVLVGTIRPFRSTDGGATFAPLTATWGTRQEVHQDTHVVRYSRRDPNRFWVGGDGGVWRTENAGAAWINMNANLNVTQFYDIAIHPSKSGVIFGGAQDNGSSARLAEENQWDLTFASGDGFMNIVDPTNPAIVFQTSYPNGGFPSIVRSLGGGARNTFAGLSNAGLESGSFPWVTPLAVAGNRLFVGSEKLYRATTSANPFRWQKISNSLGSSISVIQPTKIGNATPTYVGTAGGKIFMTNDAGAANVVLKDVSAGYPGGRVTDIAVDVANGKRAFVTRGGFGFSRLYRTLDGGATWQAIGNGLPNVPANTVAIDTVNANRIFVGTDVGVFESIDGGMNFNSFNTGLPAGLVITDLEIDNAPHVLVAGTYSRGAWRLKLANNVGNQAPAAQMSFTRNGLTVSFRDESTDADGSLTARRWSFGDGSTSTDANPVKTFATAKDYNVTLTVLDDKGGRGAITSPVVLSPPPPAPCMLNQTSGSFAGAAGQTQFPLGASYTTTAEGLHAFCLSGPTGTDFDLYLDKWDGSNWVQVGGSESASSIEEVEYNGAAGQYRVRVSNYAGEGAYLLNYRKPD